MSILIKGMEIPKDGCHHTICIYADGTVSTGGRTYTAIPVPPHGRLIDADALKPYMLNEHYKYRLVYDVNEVANAPTIIPAEEKEENFCANCHWYEAEEQYCFRNGCHSYDESLCEYWIPREEEE